MSQVDEGSFFRMATSCVCLHRPPYESEDVLQRALEQFREVMAYRDAVRRLASRFGRCGVRSGQARHTVRHRLQELSAAVPKPVSARDRSRAATKVSTIHCSGASCVGVCR